MILRDLIEALQQLIDDEECTGDELVLFAHQPNYPLQCSIVGPHVMNDLDTLLKEDSEPEKIVYLAEGGWRPRRADGSEMSPYAPRSAWGD